MDTIKNWMQQYVEQFILTPVESAVDQFQKAKDNMSEAWLMLTLGHVCRDLSQF